mmetsp:Transcript_7238/g.12063  ORF Transcript_7238/g.12063 Transcript_7238/m.12063 type:complete len:293 (-) Transcript_7238:169-1047(-)
MHLRTRGSDLVYQGLCHMAPGLPYRRTHCRKRWLVALIAKVTQRIVMDYNGYISAHLQPGIRDRAPHTYGRNDRRHHKRGWWVVPCQQYPGCFEPKFLSHFIMKHQGRVSHNAPRLQGSDITRTTPRCKIHIRQPVQKGNPSMSQIKQKFCQSLKGAGVVHIHPAVLRLNFCRPPMHHKRHTQLSEQRNPAVVHLGSVHDQPIHSLTGHQLAIACFFRVVIHDRQQQIKPIVRIDLPRTRDEIRENRVHHLVFLGHWQNMPNGHGFSGCQSLGAGIGRVIVRPCRFQHFLPC